MNLEIPFADDCMIVFREVAGVFSAGHHDHRFHPIAIPILETRQCQDHVLARAIEAGRNKIILCLVIVTIVYVILLLTNFKQ
jgi:hypothetical protein